MSSVATSSIPRDQPIPVVDTTTPTQTIADVPRDSGSSELNIQYQSAEEEESLKKAFDDLCMACRRGDIAAVDSLLSTPNLYINQMDEFDYSPLILSSLCGHLQVVELLLSRGAVCDRDTFEGARCIYGALTDEIRDLLVSFDVSKAVDSSQPFAAHISSLLSPVNEVPTKDIVFHFPHVNGVLSRGFQSFRLNRFLLAARSTYFREMLTDAWSKATVVELPSTMSPAAFKVVVDYLYLRSDSLPTDDNSLQEQIIFIAEEFKLNDLIESMEKIREGKDDKEKSKFKHDIAFKIVENARKELDTFLKDHILAEKVISDLKLEDEVDFEDIETVDFITKEQREKLLNSTSFADIIVSAVDSESDSVAYYPVNKSIISRSEYFDTMLKSDIFVKAHKKLPFYKNEKTSNINIINRNSLLPEHLPVIQISNSTASIEVAEMILCYLYHDNIPHIPLHLTIDLLFAADELFLDRLKTMCAVHIASTFDKFTPEEFDTLQETLGYDAYDLIRVSWQTRSDKLEQHITKMIAYSLEYIYQNDLERELISALISESAGRIKARQDTDTIELVDDIRYYLSRKYAVSDDFEDFDPAGQQFRQIDPDYVERDDVVLYKKAVVSYHRDIEMIDNLLDSLSLDA
ncbi:membrane protein with BTB/POZ domain [Scheffersomyces xylosifermentans]|uniref:membrane protein with BTB/POZ domain n=1 Tax=Scheffersomyces xylosifermentans TaxID=1304137 RepID=UPI00315D57FB